MCNPWCLTGRLALQRWLSIVWLLIISISSVSSAEALSDETALPIGVLLPQTGSYQSTGTWIQQGLRLALEQENWRVGPYRVRLIEHDSASDPLVIDTAWRALEQHGVAAIIGPVHPGSALRVAKLAAEDQQVVLLAGSGLNRLTRRSCAPTVFRTAFANDQYAETIARYLESEGAKKVAGIAWHHPNGVQLIDGFYRYFSSVEGEQYQPFYQPYPLSDFESLLAQVARFEPEWLYVALSGQVAADFFQAKAAHETLKNTPVIGPSMLTDSDAVRALSTAQGVLSVSSYGDNVQTPDNFAFRALFYAEYQRWPNAWAVYGFDTGQLLVQALKRVVSDDATDDATPSSAVLARALRAVSLLHSPRGAWQFSPQHSPVIPMYLRELRFARNRIQTTLNTALADSGKHCKGFD